MSGLDMGKDARSSFDILAGRRFEELSHAEKEEYGRALKRESEATAELIAANLNRNKMASVLQHLLAGALRRAGISFSYGSRSEQGYDLDLPDHGAIIRIMRAAGPTGEEQVLSAGNVILVQGQEAAEALAALIDWKGESGG